MSDASASIVIPTRNRKIELRRAIESSLAQTVPVDIIVLDDGSTDGTAEVVPLLPNIRYVRFDGSNGPCVLRNRGVAMARTPIIISIDDDAWFDSPNSVEQTLADFAEDARVGAIAIPFVNVRQGPRIEQCPPSIEQLFAIFAFIGAAHAFRRELFLRLGGYAEDFYYMGEESDLCVRQLAAGFATVLGRADPLHHDESPKRESDRADFYGYRNLLLFAWKHVPARALSIVTASAWKNGISNGLARRRLGPILRGLTDGMKYPLANGSTRRPLDWETYRMFRQLHVKPIPLRSLHPFLEQRQSI